MEQGFCFLKLSSLDQIQNQFVNEIGRNVGLIGVSFQNRHPFLRWAAQNAQGLIHPRVEFDIGRIRAQAFLKYAQSLFGVVLFM